MLRVGMMTEAVYKYKDMKGCLKTIKDVGFECCDITLLVKNNHPKMIGYFAGDKYLEKAKELKDYADSINLPLVQAHAPFPVYNPLNKRYNKRMFEKLIKCIKICGVLKIKNLVIHPWNDFKDEENIEFFKKLLPYAKEEDVIICTENMWRWNSLTQKARPCACSLPESFVNIVNGVNDPNLKACVDIGHAHMFNHLGLTPRMLLESLKDDVYCLHIHDNDGSHDNHWPPFKGTVDYKDMAIGLKNIKYNKDLILETNVPNEVKNFKEALEFYKEELININKIRDMIIN